MRGVVCVGIKPTHLVVCVGACVCLCTAMVQQVLRVIKTKPLTWLCQAAGQEEVAKPAVAQAVLQQLPALPATATYFLKPLAISGKRASLTSGCPVDELKVVQHIASSYFHW